ncbi:MAG: CAP domain-containing protein [Candidatus Staskawiczbacteria bacterium]|nr:CAP domain-containing protein [Candidatus Staskawiczbacteria bacterium]
MYVVVFVLVVKILTVGLFLPFSKNIFFADITRIDLLNLLNENREANGLNPLTESTTLNEAAKLKAQDMIANGYFSHESPSEVSPWFWFKKAGYVYKYAGENLAVGFADSNVVYNAWFNSSSHKDNLLNKNYKEVGTAIVQGFGPNGSIVVVQLFGSPLTAPVTTTTTPAPKPVVQVPVVSPVQAPAEVTTKPVEPSPEVVQEPVVNETNGGAKEVASEESLALPRVLAGSTEYVLSEPSNNTGSSLYVRFLHFIVYDNNQLLQVFSWGLLSVMSICLIINIGINYEIQRKDLIVRSLILILVLYVSTFIDKDILLQVIPQQITI